MNEEAKPLSPRMQEIQALFQNYVVPSYDRFPLCFAQGKNCEIWDVDGKRYLDFGAGIAVSTLGHGHPAIAGALLEQAQRLIHCSNLYHIEQQALLAKRIAGLTGPGKCFFPNSGAEANETLYKLARKFGNAEGRYEVITALNSFHGRTLGGISATGQEKVKTGFEPMVDGFKHVPFNDLPAVEAAISPKTAAVLIEVIQGEGGITPATPEYLFGLRRLCDEKKLLLLFDEVQCGYFRPVRVDRVLSVSKVRIAIIGEKFALRNLGPLLDSFCVHRVLADDFLQEDNIRLDHLQRLFHAAQVEALAARSKTFMDIVGKNFQRRTDHGRKTCFGTT